jgi:two-component system CheB/CheR fusion protein
MSNGMEHEDANNLQPSTGAESTGIAPSNHAEEEGPIRGLAAEEASVVVSEDPDADILCSIDFPIVGIGGSAGSVEPFIEIFKNILTNTGMAMVLVMHLARDQQSHLSDILARHTAMPVMTLVDGMEPEQNHVYVLPPDAFVTIENGTFRLSPRGGVRPFLPVDVFFESLAKAQKVYAVGVVLSGMDGDGATGLRAIKGEGGFTMVQSPSSARHPEMPRNSIAMDHVDVILDPEALGRYLVRLARRFRDPKWVRLQDVESHPTEEKNFGYILKLLKTVSGIDFRLYKPMTIRRRIARRMLMHKADSLQEYVGLLYSDTAELRALQEDILINVTRFFRDPDVFDVLKGEIIPAIVENRRADEQIRVWVAGCSSGEEVYSVAMCLLEYLTGRPLEPSIQIFGTDASESNIQKARVGIYPDSIANEVSSDRLRRFFVKTDKGYQVAKRVRDLCIFARQNLCTDPPFSRLDLVSCRNVLIYFGSDLQRSVISTFHYALREDGYLLLGSSETIREYSELFSVSDRVRKIFVRTGNAPGRGLLYSNPPSRFADVDVPAGVSPIEPRHEWDLGRMADRVILAHYGPPSVIVNSQLQIVQSRGRTSPFLEFPQGVASLQLTRMVRESIAPTVTAAVTRAIAQDLPVHIEGVTLSEGTGVHRAQLDVLPLPAGEGSGATKYYLVVFVPENGLPGEIAPLTTAEPADRAVDQLQQDLASTKLYLSSLLDEREARNQELISANEEIQSANEELQSTNEELETTKEELQSANEELQTVNDELENRNSVLTQASNDLSNLLNTVNLPVLMLSNELHIRHFTPQTQRVMSVRAQDIGRPFGEIRLDLAVDNLESRLLEVLDTLTSQEIEVQDRDGRWYFLRIRPYRTTDNKIEGLVLVLVDIDHSKRSQQQLRDARDFAASIIANTPLPLVVADSRDRIISTNDAFCNLSGLSRQALERRSIVELSGRLWDMEEKLRTLLQEVKNASGSGDFESDYRGSEDSVRTLLVRGYALQPDVERYVLLTFEDVSPHREIERLLKNEGDRLASQIALTTQELNQSRQELRALTDNLMMSQEEERRRLARELHDDISQRLAVLDMDCEASLRAVESEPQAAREKMQSVRQHIAEVSEDVRTLSHRLHPAVLEHLGLAEALEALLDEYSKREGLMTTFDGDEFGQSISSEVATGLYRIAQEALRNVVKHAGRAHVKVALFTAGDRLALEVTDSGKGFSMHQHRDGLGLISMRERARLIGAEVKVESAPRQGTKIRVSAPFAEHEIHKA